MYAVYYERESIADTRQGFEPQMRSDWIALGVFEAKDAREACLMAARSSRSPGRYAAAKLAVIPITLEAVAG